MMSDVLVSSLLLLLMLGSSRHRRRSRCDSGGCIDSGDSCDGDGDDDDLSCDIDRCYYAV